MQTYTNGTYKKLLSAGWEAPLEYEDVILEKGTYSIEKPYLVLRDKLNRTKDLLTPYIKTPQGTRLHSQVSTLLDVYRPLRFDRRLEEIPNKSNAWFKMHAMIHDYNLLDNVKTTFSNCEFPGSFIKSILYNKNTINWYGSSFLDGTVADNYGLYATEKNHWLMDEDQRGDMTIAAGVDGIAQRFLKREPKKADLYTADGGLDASSDPNNRETMNLDLHLGQMICGLQTLKEGGNMVLKQYTWFTPKAQSMIIYCTSLFDKSYIHKPTTSRPQNGEVYIICKNYKKPITDKDYKFLLSMLGTESTQTICNIDEYESLYFPLEQLANQQIQMVDERVMYMKIYRKKTEEIRAFMRGVSKYVISDYLQKYF